MRIKVYDSVDPLSILQLNLLALDFALSPEHVALFRQSGPRRSPCLAIHNEHHNELFRLDIHCRCACDVCTSFPTRISSDTTQRANPIQVEFESNQKGFRVSRYLHQKFRFNPALDQLHRTRF
jgi:hypothetical protein